MPPLFLRPPSPVQRFPLIPLLARSAREYRYFANSTGCVRLLGVAPRLGAGVSLNEFAEDDSRRLSDSFELN